ncbi:MAG: hypothetical protein RQ866_00095 [Bacteroidales bacterium]|nr:hypothetical protein [Bacteroidales bacterium]
MQTIKIIGILIKDRIKEAGKTQVILSKYSHVIKSRFGYHELSDEKCSRQAFMILNLAPDIDNQNALMEELNTVGGIEVKDMVFNY